MTWMAADFLMFINKLFVCIFVNKNIEVWVRIGDYKNSHPHKKAHPPPDFEKYFFDDWIWDEMVLKRSYFSSNLFQCIEKTKLVPPDS